MSELDIAEFFLSIPRPWIGAIMLGFCVSSIGWLIYDADNINKVRRV